MSLIRFSIPGIPPSQNSRRHHMQRYRDDQEWKQTTNLALTNTLNRNPQQGLPWDRVHIQYIFHYPRKTYADPDNLIGSMKPCLDGIKGVVMPDDSTKHIHRLGVQVEVIPGRKAGVVVDISECQCSTTEA